MWVSSDRHVSAPPTAVVTNVVTEAEWQEGLWGEAETMVESHAQEDGIDAQKSTQTAKGLQQNSS